MLLAAVAKRGYDFIRLQEALKDPVYDRIDTYVGKRGVSWLQRWRISEGLDFVSEPQASIWIKEVFSN